MRCVSAAKVQKTVEENSYKAYTSDFASRGQVGLIDLQTTDEVNIPFNFLMVYQDHITKVNVPRPLRHKSAQEVVDNLVEIFCLLGDPHILQSDNGREFKNANLAEMVREKWPDCKIITVSPDILNHKDLLKESIEKLRRC